MITGQSPRLQWRLNPKGEIRTPAEAVEIARRFGVLVLDDVAFFVDDFGLLDEQTTARGPRVTKPAGGTVYWSDLVHDVTGRVPFIIRRDILNSDEAIVAVLAHEMYELEAMRRELEKVGIPIEDFIERTRPGNPGNLHDRAWEIADAAVERMRQEVNQ
jgi:hypothetical protein